MTLKTASLLALVGTLVFTILLALDFFQTLSGILSGALPAMAILRSLITLFAGVSVTLFFYAYNKAQSS